MEVIGPAMVATAALLPLFLLPVRPEAVAQVHMEIVMAEVSPFVLLYGTWHSWHSNMAGAYDVHGFVCCQGWITVVGAAR